MTSCLRYYQNKMTATMTNTNRIPKPILDHRYNIAFVVSTFDSFIPNSQTMATFGMDNLRSISKGLTTAPTENQKHTAERQGG